MSLKSGNIVNEKYLVLDQIDENSCETVFLAKSVLGNQLFDIRLIKQYQILQSRNCEVENVCREFSGFQVPNLIIPFEICIYGERCLYITRHVDGLSLVKMLQV